MVGFLEAISNVGGGPRRDPMLGFLEAISE